MSKRFQTLNIGAANIELAEYEVGAKGALTLVNYGVAALAAPLDGGNADTILSPALLQVVREKGIKPGKVAVSVSGQMVFPKFAAIPKTGGDEKFEQLIRYEVEQNIPFPIDEMVCDRQVLGDTESGDKAVMIVAAKVDQIEAITSAVAAAGFSPELVDVAPIALTNVIRHAAGGTGDCAVILDIGAKTSSLVIVEGDKLYNRSIPVAGNTITKEIAQAFGCTPEEAEALKLEKGYVSLGGVTEDEDPDADRISKVCRAALTRVNAEISRSINFYRSQQGGGTPTKMYLTGGSALLPQVDVFFSETLGIEVEFFNPFDVVKVGPKVDATALETEAAQLASTAGVALHLAGLAHFAINLLPPSIIAERAEKAKIPFVAAGGVALAASLALVMLAFNHEADVIKARRDAVATVERRLADFDKRVTDAEAKCAEAVASAEDLRKLLAGRSAAVQRVIAVRDSLAPGMWIEKWEGGRLTVRCWNDHVKQSGKKTPDEVVVDKLKGKAVIDPASVKIADMSTIGKNSDIHQFTVEMKFK